MAGASRGRREALRVLRAVGRGRRLDRALDEALERTPEGERGWLYELTYGVVRLRGRLDHLLDHHLRSGVGSVSSLLLDVLRTGAYQLLHMESVPAYAAVSQSVELARERVGEGPARLVNGVLRSVQRSGADPELFPDPEGDPAGHLATWGSHPRWLVDRWLARWSPEAVGRLVEHDNRPPGLSIRPVGVSGDEASRRLAERGIGSTAAGRGSGALWIEDGADPVAVLEAVPAVVQDPGSSLVATYAAAEPGSRIADLCAAPGGKGLALASSADYVLAGDPSLSRLGLVRRNADRLRSRTGPVHAVVARAEHPPLAEADLVLVDVPCSGTGTLRRHPDGRWRLGPEDPGRLAALQERILEGAASVVPPGGLLVYSTCTLEPEENEDVVSTFLEKHGEYRVEPGDAVPEEMVDAEGFLRVLPQETGFDGAFAARLRRVR